MQPLTATELELLASSRRAVLGTINGRGTARLLPIAYAFANDFSGRSKALVIYSALDEKPKSVADPRSLARVRDILARPRVSLLVDRWSEEWDELAWLRVEGTASLLEPGGSDAEEHLGAVVLLRERYPQYATHRLENRPIIRVAVDRATSWGLTR